MGDSLHHQSPASTIPEQPMTSVTVTIKWGKEKIPDFTIDTTCSVETLRAQVFSVTGVQPEVQKIFLKKGKVLKDTDDISSFPLKEGGSIILMGSATEGW